MTDKKGGRGRKPDCTFLEGSQVVRLAHQTGNYKQRDEAKEQGKGCYAQHSPNGILYVVACLKSLRVGCVGWTVNRIFDICPDEYTDTHNHTSDYEADDCA